MTIPKEHISFLDLNQFHIFLKTKLPTRIHSDYSDPFFKHELALTINKYKNLGYSKVHLINHGYDTYIMIFAHSVTYHKLAEQLTSKPLETIEFINKTCQDLESRYQSLFS